MAKPQLSFGARQNSTQLKWYHTRHQSQRKESLASSIIGQFHCPQYHMVYSLLMSTIWHITLHASWLKYFPQLNKQPFSSKRGADTLSGLVSTSCSSSIRPHKVTSATSGSTNHSDKNEPTSLLGSRTLFMNGTGFLPFCFFRASPMTAFSEPLGLPQFLNCGGSLRPCTTYVQKI